MKLAVRGNRVKNEGGSQAVFLWQSWVYVKALRKCWSGWLLIQSLHITFLQDGRHSINIVHGEPRITLLYNKSIIQWNNPQWGRWNIFLSVIPCKDCDLVNVGKTGRDLDIRIKEHNYAVKTCNTNNAVLKHMYDTDHNIDWQNGRLIHKCNDYKKRKVIESICIQKYNNFNLSEGTYKINPIIRSLVEIFLPSTLSPRIRGVVKWGASFS